MKIWKLYAFLSMLPTFVFGQATTIVNYRATGAEVFYFIKNNNLPPSDPSWNRLHADAPYGGDASDEFTFHSNNTVIVKVVIGHDGSNPIPSTEFFRNGTEISSELYQYEFTIVGGKDIRFRVQHESPIIGGDNGQFIVYENGIEKGRLGASTHFVNAWIYTNGVAGVRQEAAYTFTPSPVTTTSYPYTSQQTCSFMGRESTSTYTDGTIEDLVFHYRITVDGQLHGILEYPQGTNWPADTAFDKVIISPNADSNCLGFKLTLRPPQAQPPVIDSVIFYRNGQVVNPADSNDFFPDSLNWTALVSDSTWTQLKAKWFFAYTGRDSIIDSVFHTGFDSVKTNDTIFGGIRLSKAENALGAKGTYRFALRLVNAPGDSFFQSTPFPLDFNHTRTRPILTSVSYTATPLFGTPDTATISWSAPTNSGYLDQATSFSTETGTAYQLHYKVINSQSGIVVSGWEDKTMSLDGQSGFDPTALITPPGTFTVDRARLQESANMLYLPKGTYYLKCWITSNGQGVTVSDTFPTATFTRQEPLPIIQVSRTADVLDFTVPFNVTVSTGGDVGLIGKQLQVNVWVDSVGRSSYGMTLDSVATIVLSSPSQTFGLTYNYQNQSNFMQFQNGDSLALYVRVLNLPDQRPSAIDSTGCKFAHTISIPGFNANIAATTNPTYILFPSTCRIDNVFSAKGINPNGLLGTVKFVSATNNADTSKHSFSVPCTLSLSDTLKVRWKADSLWSIARQPLNGKYRLMISVYAQGDTVNSADGDGDKFTFTWGAPLISFTAGAPAGYVYSGGRYWYLDKPDSITALTIGNNRYGGKPVSIYLKIDTINSVTPPFTEARNWYHAATLSTSQYGQNTRLPFLPVQNFSGKGYIVGVAEITAGNLAGGVDTLRAPVADNQKYRIGVDSLPAEIKSITTNKVNQIDSLEIFSASAASFTVKPYNTTRAPVVSPCSTRVTGNGKDTTVMVSFEDAGGRYSTATFNLTANPSYNWASADTHAVMDSVRASSYKFVVRPNNILNNSGTPDTVPFVIDIANPTQLAMHINLIRNPERAANDSNRASPIGTSSYGVTVFIDSAFDATPLRFQVNLHSDSSDTQLVLNPGVISANFPKLSNKFQGKATVRVSATDATGRFSTITDTVLLDFDKPYFVSDSAFITAGDSLKITWSSADGFTDTLAKDVDFLTNHDSLFYRFVLVHSASNAVEDTFSFYGFSDSPHYRKFKIDSLGSPGTPKAAYDLYVYAYDHAGNRATDQWHVYSNGTVGRMKIPESWHFAHWTVKGKRYATSTAKPDSLWLVFDSTQAANLGISAADSIHIDSSEFAWKIDTRFSAGTIDTIHILPGSLSRTFKIKGDATQPNLTARGFTLRSPHYYGNSDILRIDTLACQFLVNNKHLAYLSVPVNDLGLIKGFTRNMDQSTWNYVSNKWSLNAGLDRLTTDGIMLTGNLVRSGMEFRDRYNQPVKVLDLRLKADSTTIGGKAMNFRAMPDSTIFDVVGAHLDDESLYVFIDSSYAIFNDGVVPTNTPWGGSGTYNLEFRNIAYHADQSITETALSADSLWVTNVGETKSTTAFPVTMGTNIIGGDTIQINENGNLAFIKPLYGSTVQTLGRLDDTIEVTSYGAKGDIYIEHPEPFSVGKYGFVRVFADSGALIRNTGALQYTIIYKPKLEWGIENLGIKDTVDFGISRLPVFAAIDTANAGSAIASIFNRYGICFDTLLSWGDTAKTKFDSLGSIAATLTGWLDKGIQLSDFRILEDSLKFDSLRIKIPGIDTTKSYSRIRAKDVAIGVQLKDNKPQLSFGGTFVMDSGSFYLDSTKIPYVGIGVKWGACTLSVASGKDPTLALGGIRLKVPASFGPKLSNAAPTQAKIDTAFGQISSAYKLVLGTTQNGVGIREFQYARPQIDTFPYFDSALTVYGKLGFRIWLDGANPNYSVRIDSAGIVLNKCSGIDFIAGKKMTVDSLILKNNIIQSFAGTMQIAQDTAAWDSFGVFDFKLPNIGLSYDGSKFSAKLNSYAFRLSKNFPIDSLRYAAANLTNARFRFDNLYQPAFAFDAIEVPIPGGRLSWEPPPFNDGDKLQIDLTKITGFFGNNKALQIDGDIIFGNEFPFTGLRSTKAISAIRIGYNESTKQPKLDSILCDVDHPRKQIPLAGLANVSYNGLKVNYSGAQNEWAFTIKSPTATISDKLNELEALRGKALNLQELTLNTLGKIQTLDLTGDVGAFHFLSGVVGDQGFYFSNQGTTPMQIGIAYDTATDVYSASITNAKITTPGSLPWLGGKTVDIDSFTIDQNGYVSNFQAGMDFNAISMPFGLKVNGLRAEIRKTGSSTNQASFGKNYELSLLHATVQTPNLQMLPGIVLSGDSLRVDTVTINFAGEVLKKKFSGSVNLSAQWGGANGFGIAVHGLGLHETKVFADVGSITLPSQLGGKTVALKNFSFTDSSLYFDAGVEVFEVPLFGDGKIVFNNFRFVVDSGRIVGDQVQICLPKPLDAGKIAFTNVEILPESPYIAVGGTTAEIELSAKDLHVPIDKIGLDDFRLKLSYNDADGFRFGGSAAGQIPGIGGSLGASIALAQEEILGATFPHLRETCLRFRSAGQGLPVGATGVYLNGIEGCYWQGAWDSIVPVDYAEYCFRDANMDGRRLALRLYFTVGGDAIKGEVGFWVNVESIDVVEFGKVVIVGFVEGTECVGMTQNFSSLRGQVTIEINKFTGVRIYAGAQVHIWEDKATGEGKFTAQAKMGVAVKEAALGTYWGVAVPPWELDASMGGRVGDFANGRKGGMVWYDFPVVGELGAFFSSGGIEIGSPGDYPLAGGGSWHLYAPTQGDLSIFINCPSDTAKIWAEDLATGRYYYEGDPDVETYRNHGVLGMKFKNIAGGDSVIIHDDPTSFGDTTGGNFAIHAKFTPKASVVTLDTITEAQRINGYSVFHLAGKVTGNKKGRISLAASPVRGVCDTCGGVTDSTPSYAGDVIATSVALDTTTGAFSYDWNTKAFANDSFHVYAAYEEPNPSRDSAETAKWPFKEPAYTDWFKYVKVDNDLRLAPPKNLTYAPTDSYAVEIAWDLPDSAPAVQGFIIRYGQASNDLRQSVYAGMVRSVRIGGLEPLIPAWFSVYPYCKRERLVGDSTIIEEIYGDGTAPFVVTPGEEGELAVNQLYIDCDSNAVDLDIGIAKEIPFHIRPMVGDTFQVHDDAYDRARLAITVSRYPGAEGEDSLGLFGALSKPTLYLPLDTGEQKLSLTSLLEDVYRGNDTSGQPVCTECDSVLLYRLEPGTYYVTLRAVNTGNPAGTSMSYSKEFTVYADYGKPIIGSIQPQTALSGDSVAYTIHDRNLLTAENFVFIDSASGTPYSAVVDTARNDWAYSAPIALDAGTYHAAIVLDNGKVDTLENALHVAPVDSCAHSLLIDRIWADTGASVSLKLDMPLGTVDTAAWQVWYKPQSGSQAPVAVTWAKDNHLVVTVPNSVSKGNFRVHRLAGSCDTLVSADFYAGPGPQTSIFPAQDSTAIDSLRVAVASNADSIIVQLNNEIPVNYTDTLTLYPDSGAAWTAYSVKAFSVDSIGRKGAVASANYTVVRNPVAVASPQGGTFDTVAVCTLGIQDGLAGELRFTLDGTIVTSASPACTGPIAVTSTGTLKFRAFRHGIAGPQDSAVFTINNAQAITVAVDTPSTSPSYAKSSPASIAGRITSGRATQVLIQGKVVPVQSGSFQTQAYLTEGSNSVEVSTLNGQTSVSRTIILDSRRPFVYAAKGGRNGAFQGTTNDTLKATDSTAVTIHAAFSAVGAFNVTSAAPLAFQVTADTIVRFYGVDQAGNVSDTITERYRIVGNIAIAASPDTDSVYVDPVDVTLEVTTAGREKARIYYTLNPDLPTDSFLTYTAPITLSKAGTIRAYATDELDTSSMASFGYRFADTAGFTTIAFGFAQVHSKSWQNDTLFIQGKGQNYGSYSDTGIFAYQKIGGDFDVSLHLVAPDSAKPWTAAGLMARTDTLSNGTMAWLKINWGGAAAVQARPLASTSALNVEIPHAYLAGGLTKLRLVRRDSVLTALYCVQDNQWTSIGSAPVHYDTLFVGPAFEAADTAILSVTGFKGFQGSVSSVNTPVVSLVAPVSGLITKDSAVTVVGFMTGSQPDSINIAVAVSSTHDYTISQARVAVDSNGHFTTQAALGADGYYRITATDAASGQSAVSYLTRDTRPPVFSIVPPDSAWCEGVALVQMRIDEPGRIVFSINGNPYDTAMSPVDTGLYSQGDTAEAQYVVYFKGIDVAGNESVLDSAHYTVVPYLDVLAAPSPGIIYDSVDVLLGSTHDQGSVSFRLNQNEPWLSYVQPIRLRLPATIEAFAWDADTNLTSAIRDFRYDIVSRCSLTLASVGDVDTLAGNSSGLGYNLQARSGNSLAVYDHNAFAYTAMDTNFVFGTKVGMVQNGRSGLSVRATTDSAAKAYSMVPLSSQSLLLKKRSAAGVPAVMETLAVTSTSWLKAERTDSLRLYTSTNGRTWAKAISVPWTGPALAGLATGSTLPESLAAAGFDSVFQIVTDSVPALIVTQPADSLRTKSSTVVVQGLLRNVNAYGVLVNGNYIDVTQSAFTDTVILTGQGSRTIEVSTLDHSLSVTRTIIRDTIAPLVWTDPPATAGPFGSPLSVSLLADEPALIQYRIDTVQAWSAYTQPLQLAADTSLDTTSIQVQFRGIDSTGDTSIVLSSTYLLISPPESYASPVAGTYNEPVSVVLQAERGANIHYTLNGETPNLLDPVYYKPIVIDRTTVIRFFAQDQWGSGPMHEATFAITDTVPFDTVLVLGDGELDSMTWSQSLLSLSASGSSPSGIDRRGIQPAQMMDGDFRVMIRLDSLAGPNGAVSGLAIRSIRDSSTEVATLTKDKAGPIRLILHDGLSLNQELNTVSGAVWFQFMRHQNKLWASTSSDGIEWQPAPGYLDFDDSVWVGPIVSSGDSLPATGYFSSFHGFNSATPMPVPYPFLAITQTSTEHWTADDSITIQGHLYGTADSTVYVTVNGSYPQSIVATGGDWTTTIQTPADEDYEIHIDHIGSGIRSAGTVTVHRDANAPQINLLPLDQDLVNFIPIEIHASEPCSIFWQLGSTMRDTVLNDTVAFDTLRIGNSGLLRAWGIDFMGHHSPVVERSYHVHAPCSSWAELTDTMMLSVPTPVRLRSNSPDAVIYYTLDGSTPTTESSRFTGGYIQLFESTTIRFFAADPWSVEQTIHTKIYTRPSYIEEAFRTYLDGQYDPTTRKIYFQVTSEEPVASYVVYVAGCVPSQFIKRISFAPSAVLQYSDSVDLRTITASCSQILLWVVSHGINEQDVSLREKYFTIDLSRIAIYRSVGPNRTTALSSGTGNALTISGSTATFANAIPDNIGVGDALQYDSDGNGSIDAIVFIHGRNSSIGFTVKSATGLTPAHSVTGNSTWSIYRAYTSLAAAENLAENIGISANVRNFDPFANGVNLVSANETWNIACYADAEDAYAGGGGITIDGWTTGPENYLRVFTPTSSAEVGTSQRHDGKWKDTAYRLKAFVGLTVQDEYVRIDGLQIRNNALDDNGLKSIQANGSMSTGLRITNCIMRLDTSAFSSYGDYCTGVDLGSDAPGDVYVHNNIIYGFRFGNRSNNHGILATQRNLAGNTYVYNNTVVDCKNGITGHWSATVIAKNNLVQGCADGYKAGFHVSSNHNLSNLAGDAPGASSVNSATVAFQNASSKDYHLSFSDTSARNAGVNLSADAGLPVTEDIDGRPRTGSWDIGADETYGLLAAASVSHATYMAGAEANVTINFTTENAAPATGTVRVLFGSGFDITQAAYVSGNSGASVSPSGQALTITLGTAISASQQVSIVLADIRNPQSTGSGGSYAILTRTPAGDTLDAGTAAANTFTAGILSDASVTHDSYSTGQTANTTISFVPDNPIPVNGDIQVTFGSGFNISSAGYASGNAGSTVSKSGQVLTINAGTSISAGSGVEIVISGIVNPSTDGSGGTYAIETQNASDVKIDTGTASANTFTTPTPVAVYYSVGTSTADLKTGSPTITLSAGTATLSAAQANNIGVGDEITYSTSSKCYISGRTSSTEYAVITATGGTPSNVTTQTVNSIKRAFNRLDSAVNVARAGSSNRASDANHLNTANLVGGNFRLNIACYGDSVEVSRVTVDGWTTGASNYIKIFTPTSSTEVGTSQRHNGRWKAAGAYALKTSTADIELFAIKDDYVRVDGLQVDAYKSGSTWQDGIVLYVGASADVRISNNILKGPLLPSTGIGKNEGNGSLYVWNNILYDWRHSNGANGIGIWDTTAYLYNNTLYNCQYAINAGVTPGVVVKNNLSYNNYSNYSYTGIGSFTGTNNLSGPGSSGFMPSTNGRNGVAVVFVDSAAKDFRLASADTGAADRGADLSADANLPFPDDILGTTRTGSWDIGAAEYIPTEADHNIYYSVGTNSGALHSGTGSASTKGLLVLSSSAANNIGVGDEVRVAGNRYYIRKRESATDFRIENSAANGGTPGDTNIVFGSQSLSIYRAFNRLDSAVNVARSGSSNRASDASHLGTANLVSGNYILHIACYGDSVEVSRVTVDGWTTGASNYVKIYTPVSSAEVGTSQRHDGKLKTSGAYLLRASIVDVCVIDIKDDYIRVDGIQVDAYKSGAAWMVGINIETGSSADVRVSNCILKGPLVACSGLQKSVGTGNVYFLNNVLYDWKGSSEGQAIGFWTANGFAYNNTLYNNRVGINNAANCGGTLKNNLSYSNVYNYYAVSAYTGTNNLSGPGTNSAMPSTNSRNGVSVTFVDAANKDFHLSSNDAGAKNYGADLSNDGNLPFSTDIDGQTRSGTWDIGADEQQ